MSRNKKIIISITGIVIVVLTLLGLTYAYFLTAIQGNESDKSIEVSTANLRLTYVDGNGTITANNIMPGTTTEAKTFTVKNNGNNVVGNYKVYLESVINTFTNINDVVINMTCSSSIQNKTCTGLTEKVFPTTNDSLVSNSIDVGETQTYSLTVTYKETGVDQSVDMGKTISGKIQIYDARNVVDISGTISDAASGDYVEFHSDPKKSQINNNKEYKITAVEPGEHTFYVKSSNGSIKGSKTIVISRANMVNHTDTNIDITEDTSEIKMNVISIQENLGVEIDNMILNPYSYNSNLLSYNIINNAQINKNRTTYEPNPITKPTVQSNVVYSYKDYIDDELLTTTLTDEQQQYYFTYGDDYSLNASTGKFTLLNSNTCKFSECHSDLVGKYILSKVVDSAGSSTNEKKVTTSLTVLYKIINTTINTIELNKIQSIPDSAERTISKTEDDYGDTYYFRGDIKDNYINFNGMCWRIMRIEGDGSVKLILEDKNATCNSNSYTGDFFVSYPTYGYKTGKTENGVSIYKDDFLNATNGLYDSMKNFQTKNLNNVLDKLKNDEWCYDNSAYADQSFDHKITDLDTHYSTGIYFGSYIRLYAKSIPSFKCNGTKLTKYRDGVTNMHVGTFTADEITFAGGKFSTANSYFYLVNSFFSKKTNFNSRTWTLSLSVTNLYNGSYYITIFNLTPDGTLNGNYNSNSLSFRPAITLKSEIEITSGDGTQLNPYEIK